MEKGQPQEKQKDLFSSIPLIGRLARTALNIVQQDPSAFFRQIMQSEDEKLEQEEIAMTELTKSTVPDMIEMQTRLIVLIKAKRALLHIYLGDEDVGDRVRHLHNFLVELKEDTPLESIGLSEYDAETLRMYFNKYCG
jgi:hypothetical protein